MLMMVLLLMMVSSLLLLLQTDMDLGASHQLKRISLVSLVMSNFCRAEVTEFPFDRWQLLNRTCRTIGAIDRFEKLDTPETGTPG